MARGTPSALALGPGYLYFAALGTTEPTDLVTAWTAVSANWSSVGYCVDIDTEILTRRGWMTHDQVQDGDECLGISAEDGLARWQPILEMHRFPAQPRPMIAMTGSSHDSLTTPNHRWLVDRRPPDPPHLVTGRKGGRKGLLFTTTDSFHWADYVPCAAPVVNLPAEPKYTDALAEVIAWWVTEGSEQRGGAMRIYQSERVNPKNCAAIRAALTALFGPARESMYAEGTAARPDRNRRGRETGPAWREGEHRSCRVFYLNKPAGDVIREHAPGKVIRPGFITALTQAQLRLLLDTAIKGDGWDGNVLAQRDRDRLDPFQMAASLAGLRTTLRNIPNRGKDYWHLRIITNPEFRPRRRCTRTALIYDGLIWCPVTPTGTWLARRGGTVYFTGNTSEGNEFGYNPSTDTVEVAEELDPISVVTTGRASTLSFAMAEVTASHLRLAMNGGTLTTGSGIVTYEPPDLGAETRVMLGFESEDHTERWVFRQCFQTGTVSITRRKGADKATIAVEFSLEKPATGLRLYKAIFVSPGRA